MVNRLLQWFGLEGLIGTWPKEVPLDAARAALRRTLLQVLRPLCLALTGIYGVVGALHVLLQPHPDGFIMASFSVVNGVACASLAIAIRRDWIPARAVGGVILALGTLMLAQSLTHVILRPQPFLLALPVVIVLLVSVLQPSTALALVYDALAVTGGVALVRFSPHTQQMIYYAVWLTVMLALALLFHRMFQTAALRLHARALDDRNRAIKLETTVSALEAVRDKYDLLANNVSDVIWIRDLNLRPVYISPSVARLRGFTALEVMSQPPEEIFSEQSLSDARDWLRNELESDAKSEADKDRSRVVALEVPHKDGYGVWTEARVRFLRDDQGHPTAIVGISRDITERRAAEERLQRVLRELKRSNQELEQFAYIASHDLKEPLRVVASQLRLLERRKGAELGERGTRYLGHAVNGAERMQEMIDGLLAYSRYGASKLQLAPVPLDAVLDEVFANLAVALKESQASVHRESLPRVRGDRRKLTHLLQNLMANAVKFHGEAPPEIHVGTAEPRDGQITLYVRDHGIGIPLQHHDRVFRLFERLHTREEYEGTGIGLALCRRIVEQHGGHMWLDSEPGQGTTFYFTLPKEESGQGAGKEPPDAPQSEAEETHG